MEEPDADGRYDAFASHATDPDGALVRRVKAELEAFHTRAGVQQRYKSMTGETFSAIRICVDGKDFVFPKTDPRQSDPIDALVRDYLLRSESLLVFSGTETPQHPWINKEIEWFRELNPEGAIHFALTHASDPDRSETFKPTALGDFDLGLFTDLRGYYRRAGARAAGWFHAALSARQRIVTAGAPRWGSVRDFEEELARLAARLLSNRGTHSFAVEDLERSFERALARSRRWRSVFYALVGLSVLGLFGALTISASNLAQEQRLRTNRVWTSAATSLRAELNAGLISSLALSLSAIANGDTEDGPLGAIETMQRLARTESLYTRQPDPGSSDGNPRRGQIETLTELGNGKEVLFGGVDGYLVLFDTVERKVVAETFLAETRILDIALLPSGEGEEVAIGTRLGAFFVRIERSADGAALVVVARSESDEDVFGLDYDAVHDRIVGGRMDGSVVAFDRPVPGKSWAARKLYTLMDPDFAQPGEPSEVPAGISDFALRRLPSGISRGYITSWNHFALAIDLARDGATEVWPAYFNQKTALTAIDVDEAGNIVVVTDLDGRIFVVDGATGELVKEVFSYRSNPASLSRDPSKTFRFARPDVLANVAIDLHPSGLFLGVASHDRTIKFFDTGTLADGGIAVAIHDRMARSIAFSAEGLTAYTMSDDGVLQRSRPLESFEPLRVAGVASGHQLTGQQGLILKSESGAPLKWVSGEDVSPFPGLPRDSNWTLLKGAPDRILVFGRDTHAYGLGPNGAKMLCGGRSLDDVLGLAETEEITSGSAYQVGPNTVVVAPTEASTRRLFVVDLGRCEGRPLSGRTYPDGAKIVAAEGLVAIAIAADRMQYWTLNGLAVAKEGAIGGGGELEHLAFGPGGSTALAVLAEPETRVQSLCLCTRSRRSAPAPDGPACRSISFGGDCKMIELPASWSRTRIDNVYVSASGRYGVVQGSDSALGLVRLGQSLWDKLRVNVISPAQNRPLGRVPFAFSADEEALAVPAGDTGIRVINPEGFAVLSALPTPSRVYDIGFAGDLLVSSDGASQAVILRAQPWRPEAIAERACDYWPAEASILLPQGTPPISPRADFCE